MKSKIVRALLMSLAVSSVAFASEIEIGEPSYGGSGCPAGSASVVLSHDSKSMSILFDEYLVEAGGHRGKRIKRKSCNVAIPVHVPQGYSVSIFTIDYRGYISVPRGGMARYGVEYFFAGQRGPRYRKTFRGGFDDDYLLTNRLAARSLVWSKCGVDTILRANTSMMLRTNRRKDEALATVDSADVTAGIVYHFQWKRCNGHGGGEDDWNW